MALRNIFATGVATLGQLLGLKEGGRSEALAQGNIGGALFGTGPVAVGQQTKPLIFGSAGGAYVDPNKQSTQTPPPDQTPPAKGATSAGGGTPATPVTTQPTFDINAEAANRAAAEQARVAAEQATIKGGIQEAYNPVFAELDRQAGTIPSQKSAFETQVANLAQQQSADVTSETGKLTSGLESQKGVEQTRAGESLRNLEQDVRNILQASTLYFGARGAADSSAPGAASEAITKVAQQSRAKVLSTRNEALAAIDQRINDVKSTAEVQSRKVDEWKSNKLFEVAQWASNTLDQLNQQKASATGQQALAIANMIQNTQAQFVDALRKIDDNVYNYKQSISTWQQQRQADIADFKTKLGIQAGFTNTTPAQYKIVTDAFGRTFAVNPTNPNDVKDITGTLFTPQKKDQQIGLPGLSTQLGIQPPTVQ